MAGDERKYLDIFGRLKQELPPDRPDPLPGFFARRKRDLPPSREIIERIPEGEVRLIRISA